MDYRCKEPDPEARGQNTRQRYLFLEAEQCNEKKEDAGENTPQRSLREALHDFGVALVLHIDPHQDQGPSQRHDADQAGSGWELLCDSCGNEDYGYTECDFEEDLHYLSPFV